MAIKFYRTKFDEKLFDEFERYLESGGREVDEFDEGDIEAFLQGRMGSATPVGVEAFLQAMARRGLSKMLSLDIEFDIECEGCGEMVSSSQGVEVVFEENESIFLCERCAEVVSRIKDDIVSGKGAEEIAELANRVSEGKVQVIVLDE